MAKQKGRQLLKFLMHVAATIPSMSGNDAPFVNAKGQPSPEWIITSTSNLSAYNLNTLKAKLTASPLINLFGGVLNAAVRPVLLDCGASACTSPHLDAFEPDSLQTLEKPITLEGVGGGVEISQQGILKYETVDDNGNPLILRVPGYYAPHLKQSLFSPQILFMTSQTQGYLELHGYTAILRFPNQISLTLNLDLHC